MATLLTEVNSVLGIEIGSVHTRAILFDVVEESYQFIAASSTLSTYEEPYFNVMIGIVEAIGKLQDITGKYFLDLNKKLIIPSNGSVEGVDKLLITLSCGPDPHLVTFGLLNDISLATANQLAKTVPVIIKDSFGINDRRSVQSQVDALLAAKPDILVFAGGSDRGATRSIARMANMIHAAVKLLPDCERPKILYCGNYAMVKRVKEILEKVTTVNVTNNIKPEIESEDLLKASHDLNQMIVGLKAQQITGLEQILLLCSDQPLMSGFGFQRVIQFLGKLYDPVRGVLGIDLGSAHTIVAYANREKSSLNTLPIGTGIGLETFLQKTPLSEITRWLPDPIPDSQIMNYLWQKTIFPKSTPMTTDDLHIELAVIRQIMMAAMQEMDIIEAASSRSFEPILISGAALTHTASPWQILLTLVDGIQPVGITPLVMDKHGILSILGAAAKTNPLLPVQVLESTAFINLATVITLESPQKPGNVILQARLQSSSGARHEIAIKQGSLVSLPLAFGESGLLYLKPVKKIRIADIEINDEPIKVKGGVCGIVFDSRGRPISLPEDGTKRREMIKSWLNLEKAQ